MIQHPNRLSFMKEQKSDKLF